jgi:hypothetical protein
MSTVFTRDEIVKTQFMNSYTRDEIVKTQFMNSYIRLYTYIIVIMHVEFVEKLKNNNLIYHRI